jgi:hypothetical protein
MSDHPAMTPPDCLCLYLNICLRCQSLPVKHSSWSAEGAAALPYCVMCGKQRETIRMAITIPVSLLNNEAYSEWALQGTRGC